MTGELALISVSNKDGVTDLAAFLYERGVEILSTGGTAKAIRGVGTPVTEVGEYTGFPESPDGLVKTLHPKIHGGWLMNNPENQSYNSYCAANEIQAINYVVVNLYPFEKFIEENPDCTLEEAMKFMDIGGPAMLRGAAKASLKYGTTTVISDPKQYDLVMTQLKAYGEVKYSLKSRLAIESIKLTRDYDEAIVGFMENNFHGGEE